MQVLRVEEAAYSHSEQDWDTAVDSYMTTYSEETVTLHLDNGMYVELTRRGSRTRYSELTENADHPDPDCAPHTFPLVDTGQEKVSPLSYCVSVFSTRPWPAFTPEMMLRFYGDQLNGDRELRDQLSEIVKDYGLGNRASLNFADDGYERLGLDGSVHFHQVGNEQCFQRNGHGADHYFFDGRHKEDRLVLKTDGDRVWMIAKTSAGKSIQELALPREAVELIERVYAAHTQAVSQESERLIQFWVSDASARLSIELDEMVECPPASAPSAGNHTVEQQPSVVRLQLTLNLDLDPNGEDEDYVGQRVNSNFAKAIAGGVLTVGTDAVVTKLYAQTVCVSSEAADL